MKRVLPLILLLVLLAAVPAAAQEDSLLDWIPADYAGFLRLDMDSAGQTLNRLNFGVYIASIFQPTRLAIDSALSYDDFFPLSALDIEDISFGATVLPWLKDEMIVAYRSLSWDYAAAVDDILLILPTEDPFDAANDLARVIQQQDLLEQDVYRGVTIYHGDQISLAFTPLAVLIGSDEAIRQALDTASDEADGLTAGTTYQAVRAAIRSDLPVFAYFRDRAAANGLGYVLSGGSEATSLLASVGAVLTELTHADTVESALLNGDVDGLGVGLQLGSTFSTILSATAVFHTIDDSLVDSGAAFDPAVLDYVPRSALLVHSGSNAQRAVYTSLAALPLSSFAGRVLGGFPVRSVVPPDAPAPTDEDLAAAVNGLAAALDTVNGISLFDGLVDHLQGSYSFALLPRPNNPLPVLNTPYDALFVAQVNDGDDVLERLSSLLGAYAGEDNIEAESLEDRTFTVLRAPDTGEALLRMTLIEDTLLIATGDAAEVALNAYRGDNRLTDQPRWTAVSEAAAPNFYVDVSAFYSTFFPAAAAQAASALRLVSVYSRALGEGLYEIELRGTLPPN